MEDKLESSNSAEPSEQVVTREALHEKIWSTPMTKIAAGYGVTTSYMVKVLTLLRIPRPPVGYWSKVAVGKGIAPPELPSVALGDLLVWDRMVVHSNTPKASRASSRKPKRRSIAETGLPRRHPLLVGIEDHFKKVRESDSGYVRPTKRAMADLIVSRISIGQAVEFANQLYLAFMKKGLSVGFSDPAVRFIRQPVDHREDPGKRYTHESYWWPHRPTVVHIGSVVFGVTIYEVSEYVQVKRVDEKYVRSDSLPVKTRAFATYREWVHSMDMPSGRLCLQVYSPYYQVEWVKRWVEDEPGQLIGKIPGILKLLIAETPGIAVRVQEAAEQSRLESQKRKLEWEAYEKRETEKRRLKVIHDARDGLEAVIKAWARIKGIQAFFDDIERLAEQLGHEEAAAILARLAKAKALIGEQDALKHFEAWVPPPI